MGKLLPEWLGNSSLYLTSPLIYSLKLWQNYVKKINYLNSTKISNSLKKKKKTYKTSHDIVTPAQNYGRFGHTRTTEGNITYTCPILREQFCPHNLDDIIWHGYAQFQVNFVVMDWYINSRHCNWIMICLDIVARLVKFRVMYLNKILYRI